MVSTKQFLVLVRHGQTLPNLLVAESEDELYYAASGSDRNVELTEDGAGEANQAGLHISRFFPETRPIRRILRSPFRRVEQTSDSIAAHLPYEPELVVDERLCKRDYGVLWNVTYRGLEELFPEEHARFQDHGPLAYRPPEGENYPDLFARVDELYDECIEPSDETLVVVTHLVVVLALRRRLDGLADEEVLRLYEETALPNGYVLIYERSGPGSQWTLHSAFKPETADAAQTADSHETEGELTKGN